MHSRRALHDDGRAAIQSERLHVGKAQRVQVGYDRLKAAEGSNRGLNPHARHKGMSRVWQIEGGRKDGKVGERETDRDSAVKLVCRDAGSAGACSLLPATRMILA
jgi:hypothetical protein